MDEIQFTVSKLSLNDDSNDLKIENISNEKDKTEVEEKWITCKVCQQIYPTGCLNSKQKCQDCIIKETNEIIYISKNL